MQHLKDVDEDLQWSLEAHLQFLAVASATVDFMDARQSATCEAYVGQLVAVESHCAAVVAASSTHAAAIIELAVDTITKVKHLPSIVCESWCRIVCVALVTAAQESVGGNAAAEAAPKCISRLVSTVKMLSKDRSDNSAATACTLDASLRLLQTFLSSLLSNQHVQDATNVVGVLNACVSLSSVPGGSSGSSTANAASTLLLNSTHLPHPSKSFAQAARVSAMRLVPFLVECSVVQAQYRGQSAAHNRHSSPTTTLGKSKNIGPRWAQGPTAGAATTIGAEWLAYIRKGIEGRDIAVKEAAVHCLADCLWRAALPDSQLAWMLEMCTKVTDASIASPQVLSSAAHCIGAVLAFLAVGNDAGSKGKQSSPLSSNGSSSWTLWRASGTSPQDATPISGDPWSVFRGLLRPSMTRVTQAMLGDALGMFLSIASGSRPQWYASAVDPMLTLAFPHQHPEHVRAPSSSANTASLDNRAYVPKIITRAVSVWCGVAADNDTHRQAVMAALIPFIKADLPKQVSQTALTCLSQILSVVRYVRSDIAGPLFSLSKVLCISMTHVATAASDVCARVASLDSNALYAILRMHTDLSEDVNPTEPLTHALMGVSKIITALPHDTLIRHAAYILEIFTSSFVTLSNIQHYSGCNKHDTASSSSGEELLKSEAMARRLEQAHSFAQLLLSTAAKAADGSFILSPAVLRMIAESCNAHIRSLVDAVTEKAEGVSSTKATKGGCEYTAPWLRAALAVATTARLLGEHTLTKGSDGLPCHTCSGALQDWFCFLRQATQSGNKNAASPAAATTMLLKFRREVWLNIARTVERLAPRTAQESSSRGEWANATGKEIVGTCVQLALEEISSAVGKQCPVFCSDDCLFPPSTSGFLAPCRRTLPLTHQHALSLTAAAAAQCIAMCFASPIHSSAQFRIEIIRTLFDVLLQPMIADGTVARWNVVVVIEHCMREDVKRSHLSDIDAGDRRRGVWVRDVELQAVAATLRAQLIGAQFCAATISPGDESHTNPSVAASCPAVLDIQLMASRALAQLALLTDSLATLVSHVALEQWNNTTGGSGTTASSSSSLPGSPSRVDRAAAGSIILLAECSTRLALDTSHQLLPLITSHMNAHINRFTTVGPVAVSSSSTPATVSGFFGDPCAPIAIVVGLAIAHIAVHHGEVVVHEIFPAQLQPTLLLRPSTFAVDSMLQNLLWAGLCNAERCIAQSRAVGGDDPSRQCNGIGGRPVLLVARHSWEAANLRRSVTDCETLHATLVLLRASLVNQASSTGVPRSRGGGGATPVSSQLVHLLLHIHPYKMPIRMAPGPHESGAACPDSISLCVAECATRLLSVISNSGRRRDALAETRSDLLGLASRIDAALCMDEHRQWEALGNALVASMCAISSTNDVLFELISSRTVVPPKVAGEDELAAHCDAQRIAAKKSEDYGEDVDVTTTATSAAAHSSHLSRAATDVRCKEAAINWLAHALMAPTTNGQSLDDIVRICSLAAALAESAPVLTNSVRTLLTAVASKYFADTSRCQALAPLARHTQTSTSGVPLHPSEDVDAAFFGTSAMPTPTPATFAVSSYRTQFSGAVRQLVRSISSECHGVAAVLRLSSAFFASQLSDHVSNCRVLESLLARICALEESQSFHCGAETIPLLAYVVDSAVLLAEHEQRVACEHVGTAGPRDKAAVKPYREVLRSVLHTHTSIQHTMHTIAVSVLNRVAASCSNPEQFRWHSPEPSCVSVASQSASAELLFHILWLGCQHNDDTSGTQTQRGSWVGPTLRQAMGACACALVATCGGSSRSDSDGIEAAAAFFSKAMPTLCSATQQTNSSSACVFSCIMAMTPFMQVRHRETIEQLVVCHLRNLGMSALSGGHTQHVVLQAIANLLRVAFPQRCVHTAPHPKAASPAREGALPSQHPPLDLLRSGALRICAQLRDPCVEWVILSHASAGPLALMHCGALSHWCAPSPDAVLRVRRTVGPDVYDQEFSSWIAAIDGSPERSVGCLATSFVHNLPQETSVAAAIDVLRSVLLHDDPATPLGTLRSLLLHGPSHQHALPAYLTAGCSLLTSHRKPPGGAQIGALASFVASVVVDAVDFMTKGDEEPSRCWVKAVLPCVACYIGLSELHTVGAKHAIDNQLVQLLRGRLTANSALRAQAPVQSAADREALRLFLSSSNVTPTPDSTSNIDPQRAAAPHGTTSAAQHKPQPKRVKLAISVGAFT